MIYGKWQRFVINDLSSISLNVQSRQQIQVPPFLSKGSLWGFPHHYSGDDRDERITVGEQAVWGLRAAVSVPLRRRDAFQKGMGVIPRRPSLLHLLVIVVLDYFASIIFSHDRGGVWCHWTVQAWSHSSSVCKHRWFTISWPEVVCFVNESFIWFGSF